MRLRGFSGISAVLLVVGILLSAASATLASGHGEPAPEEVRRAVEAGEIKALVDILAGVRSKLPGEIVGVKIEREHGRWIYEFRVVDGKGRLYEFYVDARSGEIEKIKEK